ncbi:MAG: ferritin-like domain-containing protein [Jatrophihabitantaceae bacterium]
MDGNLDEPRFRELLVESGDLQSDAMAGARHDLNAYVEAAQESRFENRRDLRVGGAVLGAGALGIAALALASPAFAASSKDVMALQTAASLENLAVATYTTALTLPFIGGKSANGVVKAFATMTKAQHADHAKAFNAAVVKLGGKAQNKPDPKYLKAVNAAVPTIKGAADVVGLAITLEDVAAQTYTKNVGQVSTSELRQLFSSVAGVEAQHKAILLAVKALLGANLASEIALPPNAAKLPAAAGSVGFPDGFYPTSMASPVAEGAVQ